MINNISQRILSPSANAQFSAAGEGYTGTDWYDAVVARAECLHRCRGIATTKADIISTRNQDVLVVGQESRIGFFR